MTEILRYIIEYCSFLYAPNRFRFVDSLTSESFGGDAYLILESDSLRLRFVRDRGRLVLEFQNADQENNTEWFSIDILQRFLAGERQYSSALTSESASFLELNIDEIERRFCGERSLETIRELHRLERLRAKEHFG